MTQRPKVLFTDGEGPIVFKDLAADVTERVIPGLFPTLSLYDDYLAEKGTEGYQAGDTLALVAPHFLLHGVTDGDIADEARDAKVCLGVEDYISGLKRDGWNVRIISTAYSQLWELVGTHIGVPMKDIACTNLDLAGLRKQFGTREMATRTKFAEEQILSLGELRKAAEQEVDQGRGVVDVFEDERFAPLLRTLDGFYWTRLEDMGYRVLDEVRVMGGRRKVGSAKQFAQDLGVEMRDVVYVGDSITDDAMHVHLKAEGGLPIAINGNGYALRNAVAAIATRDMRNVRPMLDAWNIGGHEGVRRLAQESGLSFSAGGKEGAPRHEEPGFHYDLVDRSNTGAYQELLAVHKEFRKEVRGAATARLG